MCSTVIIVMTEAQRRTLFRLCARYGCQFDPSTFRPSPNLPGFLSGWVGPAQGTRRYVSVSPEGGIAS